MTDMSFPLAADRSGPSRPLLREALRRNRLLLAGVAIHALAVSAALVVAGVPVRPGMVGVMTMMFSLLLPIYLFLLLVGRFWVMAVRVRPERPIPWLVADLRDRLFNAPTLLSGAISLVAVALFASCFGLFKEAIPALNGFGWDPAFAGLDRLLHGGRDPYALLLPLFGHPYAVTAFNIAYHMWFFVIYFGVFVAVFARRDGGAGMAYLLGFVLVWGIGGNLLAVLLSSAGPVYYQPLGLGADFLPLMEHLRAGAEVSPVWALNVQDVLWDGYANDGPVAGISAMPSMHVASATLAALYGFTFGRLAGWLLTAFAAVIQVGSVLLAWHYAVDGYAGILLALAAWTVARRLVRGQGAALA